MSRKLPRLLFVASMVTGLGVVPLVGADAAGRTSSVDAHADRFEVPGAPNNRRLDIYVGDTAAWNILEGEHTVTPKDKARWGSDNDVDADSLKPDSDRLEVTFKIANRYVYYCKIHGGLDEATKEPFGMWGEINVTDPNATTTTTAPTTTSTAPPTTQPTAQTTTTTRPPTPVTTAPTASSTGTHTPSSAAPAPTTTTAKDKNKKPGKDDTTTTTVPALTEAPPPPNIPDEAIIPSLPGMGTPSSADVNEGDSVSAPGSTPEGEAIALLKSEKRSGKKLLIASGIGLGILGFGAAGYKFSNRSSKYFPA